MARYCRKRMCKSRCCVLAIDSPWRCIRKKLSFSPVKPKQCGKSPPKILADTLVHIKEMLDHAIHYTAFKERTTIFYGEHDALLVERKRVYKYGRSQLRRSDYDHKNSSIAFNEAFCHRASASSYLRQTCPPTRNNCQVPKISR